MWLGPQLGPALTTVTVTWTTGVTVFLPCQLIPVPNSFRVPCGLTLSRQRQIHGPKDSCTKHLSTGMWFSQAALGPDLGAPRIHSAEKDAKSRDVLWGRDTSPGHRSLSFLEMDEHHRPWSTCLSEAAVSTPAHPKVYLNRTPGLICSL